MNPSSRFPVHKSELGDRRLYVVMHAGRIAYCLVRNTGRHKCGYLNLSRKEWFDLLDKEPDYASDMRITFQGIPSKSMLIPAKVRRSIPIQMEYFWIGTDTYGMRNASQVPDDVILEHLCKVIAKLQEGDYDDSINKAIEQH